MLHRLLPIILCFAASVAFALERKASIDVNVLDLTAETQAHSDAQGGMDMVWWIPIEFWAAAFGQDASMTELLRDEMLAALRPYSILAVVQANFSSFGAPKFLERDQIRDGLIIQYRYGEGRMKQSRGHEGAGARTRRRADLGGSHQGWPDPY